MKIEQTNYEAILAKQAPSAKREKLSRILSIGFMTAAVAQFLYIILQTL
ncbi:MAG: hypothetical protein ACOVNR_06240 [Chitinophagaceae bacterium]